MHKSDNLKETYTFLETNKTETGSNRFEQSAVNDIESFIKNS